MAERLRNNEHGMKFTELFTFVIQYISRFKAEIATSSAFVAQHFTGDFVKN